MHKIYKFLIFLLRNTHCSKSQNTRPFGDNKDCYVGVGVLDDWTRE